ncbi:MAG: UMP kinase [Oscillospiraceae bacterium]|jgi:uridylate kinase|nr:UMP kinase [Oscillospiraceae bacterium]
MPENKYKRVILKLSGEALAGEQKTGFHLPTATAICESIKKAAALGVEIGIVVGGGNFWRGRSSQYMDTVRADHIGMLATAMNAIALADVLESIGCEVRVQTTLPITAIAEPYIWQKTLRHFAKGRIVIFGCGVGRPYYTTDSAAALQAAELSADILLKATMVDGVYDKDPNVFDDAVKLKEIRHIDMLTGELAVLDGTAAAMCRERKIPIRVFNLQDPDNIYRACLGEDIGTLVND